MKVSKINKRWFNLFTLCKSLLSKSTKHVQKLMMILLHHILIVVFGFNGLKVVILMSMAKNTLKNQKSSKKMDCKIYWAKIQLHLSRKFRTAEIFWISYIAPIFFNEWLLQTHPIDYMKSEIIKNASKFLWKNKYIVKEKHALRHVSLNYLKIMCDK